MGWVWVGRVLKGGKMGGGELGGSLKGVDGVGLGWEGP